MTNSKILEEPRAHIRSIVDQESFTAIYAQYCDIVYANILRFVKNEGNAEDILHDVFIQLWENRNKLHDKSIGGWLFVVSHNKALDFLKRSVKFSLDYIGDYDALTHLVADQDDKEEVYIQQVSLLKEAVEQLPLRMRRVFQLCRLEGKSKEEVASLLGISSNSVTDYLKQSNRAIRSYIQHNYPSLITNSLLFTIGLSSIN